MWLQYYGYGFRTFGSLKRFVVEMPLSMIGRNMVQIFVALDRQVPLFDPTLIQFKSTGTLPPLNVIQVLYHQGLCGDFLGSGSVVESSVYWFCWFDRLNIVLIPGALFWFPDLSVLFHFTLTLQVHRLEIFNIFYELILTIWILF